MREQFLSTGYVQAWDKVNHNRIFLGAQVADLLNAKFNLKNYTVDFECIGFGVTINMDDPKPKSLVQSDGTLFLILHFDLKQAKEYSLNDFYDILIQSLLAELKSAQERLCFEFDIAQFSIDLKNLTLADKAAVVAKAA